MHAAAAAAAAVVPGPSLVPKGKLIDLQFSS